MEIVDDSVEGMEFDGIKFDGIRRLKIHFKNKYTLSIIRGEHTYGGDIGLFELAVMSDGVIVDALNWGEHVKGFVSEAEVFEYIDKVANL